MMRNKSIAIALLVFISIIISVKGYRHYVRSAPGRPRKTTTGPQTTNEAFVMLSSSPRGRGRPRTRTSPTPRPTIAIRIAGPPLRRDPPTIPEKGAKEVGNVYTLILPIGGPVFPHSDPAAIRRHLEEMAESARATRKSRTTTAPRTVVTQLTRILERRPTPSLPRKTLIPYAGQDLEPLVTKLRYPLYGRIRPVITTPSPPTTRTYPPQLFKTVPAYAWRTITLRPKKTDPPMDPGGEAIEWWTRTTSETDRTKRRYRRKTTAITTVVTEWIPIWRRYHNTKPYWSITWKSKQYA